MYAIHFLGIYYDFDWRCSHTVVPVLITFIIIQYDRTYSKVFHLELGKRVCSEHTVLHVILYINYNSESGSAVVTATVPPELEWYLL